MPVPRPRRPETLIVLIAALVVLVGGAAVIGWRLWSEPDDRVPAGVTIGGVEVGGLSADEAERAVLANATGPAGTVAVTLDGEPGFPQHIPVNELDPVPRARMAVRQAMDEPSLGSRILGQVGLERTRSYPLTYRADPALARRHAAAVAAAVDTPAKDATIGVGGGRIVTGAGRTGRAVDQKELSRRIINLTDVVQVPVTEVQPAVGDAAVAAARTEAAQMVRRAVVVRGAGRRATIDRDTLVGALRFTPAKGQVDVTLDGPTLAAAIRPAFADILTAPTSAGFAVQGETVSVTPSREGRRIDAAELAARVEAAAGSGPVVVPIAPVAPGRTTAQAKSLRIRELVGEFTTPYACCQPRVTNIQRGAQILDGTIIPAGATFSLNTALGRRTRSRGFVPAPQISDGQLEDAVGGGVSQIATTTYNAAFFSGLDIITHTPHEFWITRYPPGREATVSWGGPELIFRNDWKAAILMDVTATDTSLTVKMYSSKLGRRVTTSTTGDTPVEGTAFSVAVHRKVFVGDELKSDTTSTWDYKAPPAGE